jgi:hypothetical protein
MFKSGMTRTVITPRIGHQMGSGLVEFEDPLADESDVMTLRPTGHLVEANNIHGIEIPAGFFVSLATIDGEWAIVNFDKKCAVQIPRMDSRYFLTEYPRNPQGLEVELGAWIDIPPNVHAWPEGARAPEQILGRSLEDPKHYKLFKYRREIDGTDWEDTGMSFGGTFTAESWEAFARSLASLNSLQTIPGDEGH